MIGSMLRRKRTRSEMSFLEHVEDLRKSVLRVSLTFVVGALAALIFYREIPALLRLPLEWAKEASPAMAGFGQLREFTFMGVWNVLMYTAAAAGIGLASPVLLYEIVRFVGPALTERERRGLMPFCVAALALFIAGAVLAFTYLTPMSIVVWHDFAVGLGLLTDWQGSDYYGFVVMMSLLTGIALQFPLALILLMILELVRPNTLLRSWRGMLFGIVVLAAVITPIGDPLTLGILSGILFVLYLAAVMVGKVLVRRKRVARGDSPEPEDEDTVDVTPARRTRSPRDDPAPEDTDGDLRPLD